MLRFSHPPFGSLAARPIAFKEFPNTYFWIWVALDQFYGNTPPEDWEEVGSEEDSFLIVSSQLHQVAAGMNAHGPTGTFYARTEDLDFAARYPVLLAQQAPATVPPQKPSEPLIGTDALILDQDTIRLCALEHLGEKGQEVWQMVKQGTTRIPLRGTLQGQERSWEARETGNAVKHELWERAQVASKHLAVLYWQLHEHMKKQEASSAYRQLPLTPNVLRGKGMIIPQLDPVEGVLLALSHAQREQGGWKVVNAIPTYTHQRSTSMTEVTVRPQGTQVIAGDLTGQLWQRVRQFNDVDGDIFLAMLAQFLGTPQDVRGGVWITTQQILEYRGIQPKTHKQEHPKAGSATHRRAGHRFEDMQEIAEGMNRIRDTHITVRTWKENHKRKTTRKQARKRVFQQESYLVTITDYIKQAQLITEDEMETISDPGLVVAWYYTPGTCLETLLSGPNYRAAWLLQQALHYDPYHEQWEKRLARYFTFQMRMNTEFGGTTIKRRIGELVDELALPLNTDDPTKTKKRFEKAMHRLLQDKIISSWGPEDLYEQAMKQRPRYNWIDTWLAYEIEISAAPLLENQVEAIMEHVQMQRRQRQKLLLQEKSESQDINDLEKGQEEDQLG